MGSTHKNTVARIVICHQDGRERFPVFVFGASSLIVGQTHNENHNRVRICYMLIHEMNIYKQYMKQFNNH